MKKFIEIQGNTNDLLTVDDTHSLKSTRFFVDVDNDDVENSETFDVTVTSIDKSGQHSLFDKILNKNIIISIQILD